MALLSIDHLLKGMRIGVGLRGNITTFRGIWIILLSIKGYIYQIKECQALYIPVMLMEDGLL